jgi:hypothetical protein
VVFCGERRVFLVKGEIVEIDDEGEEKLMKGCGCVCEEQGGKEILEI